MTRTAHEHRNRRIVRALAAILGLNLVVAIAKLIYGDRSGAIAITADGIHSLLDASSNVIGLVGIAVASARPTRTTRTATASTRRSRRSASRRCCCSAATRSSVRRSAACARRPAEIGTAGFLIVVGTLIINLAVVVYERREGRD